MTRPNCRQCVVAKQVSGCLFGHDEVQCLMRKFDLKLREDTAMQDPIEEQLLQCSDAFKAGELLSRLFGELRERELSDERLMPPAGMAMPPLV